MIWTFFYRCQVTFYIQVATQIRHLWKGPRPSDKPHEDMLRIEKVYMDPEYDYYFLHYGTRDYQSGVDFLYDF